MQEQRMHQQEQKCLANAITPWQMDACFAACQIPGDRARSLFTWNRGVTRLALQNDRWPSSRRKQRWKSQLHCPAAPLLTYVRTHAWARSLS